MQILFVEVFHCIVMLAKNTEECPPFQNPDPVLSLPMAASHVPQKPPQKKPEINSSREIRHITKSFFPPHTRNSRQLPLVVNVCCKSSLRDPLPMYDVKSWFFNDIHVRKRKKIKMKKARKMIKN